MYKDRGLLLCECYVVREFAGFLPRSVRREFIEDLGDLEDIKMGVERQLKTVARMWRVWGKYLTQTEIADQYSHLENTTNQICLYSLQPDDHSEVE